MANWARLQEQLTGKRVIKRAKHSIHFDNGDGSVTANFSGTPCHYEEGGLWKPIDTRLLLGADGFYGCPHSPVKVHKDGRVKVDKSDYSQFTKLPGSPLGRVDGDKIVREFPGGYQELFVTEDGFREVITVVKRTFPIEKFLAKQSGTLPSAYKTSPQTAVDANGNEFVITADTKAFGDWLDGAAFPVTIDPDFSVQPDAAAGKDTHINTLNNSSWATDTRIIVGFQSYYFRGLLQFDLSSIPTSSTVSSSTVTLKNGTSSPSTYAFHRLLVAWEESANWINRITSSPTAWSANGGQSGTDYTATATATGTHLGSNVDQWDITSDAQYWVTNPSSNYGNIIIADGSSRVDFASSDNATESYRPVLTVTYTTGATGTLRRTNMNAQMSNLTGGFN